MSKRLEFVTEIYEAGGVWWGTKGPWIPSVRVGYNNTTCGLGLGLDCGFQGRAGIVASSRLTRYAWLGYSGL